LEWARQLDADHSINHRKQNLVAEVDTLTDHRGVDIVLDCVAGDIWRKGLAGLAHGGISLPVGQQQVGSPWTIWRRFNSKHLKIYGSTLGSGEESAGTQFFCKFQEYDRLSIENSF
jgi:NADPH:quinone reductase-like Zn-dependent oxidoreductase